MAVRLGPQIISMHLSTVATTTPQKDHESSNISWALESWVLVTRGFYILLALKNFHEKLKYFSGC